MECSLFAPSHITGFFQIFHHDDPLKSGSRGAGVVLDRGVITTLRINEGKTDVKIKINGNYDSKNSYISMKTLDLVKERFKLEDKKIRIDHIIQVPVGAGFGTSAGCALGTSLTMAKVLQLPLTYNQAASIAHQAELELKSGLGDVIAEIYGGMVIRLKEGAPGIGVVDKIILDDLTDIFLISKTLGEIDTAEIIGNSAWIKKINQIGRDLISMLVNNPYPTTFLKLSRKFAEETSIMGDEIKEIINILDEETQGSSMAMLGNTVFGISEIPDTSLDGALVTKIDPLGCRFI